SNYAIHSWVVNQFYRPSNWEVKDKLPKLPNRADMRYSLFRHNFLCNYGEIYFTHGVAPPESGALTPAGLQSESSSFLPRESQTCRLSKDRSNSKEFRRYGSAHRGNTHAPPARSGRIQPPQTDGRRADERGV